MTDADLLLRAAFTQHQAGALDNACGLYTQVLALRPADHDALHLLGVARAALGYLTEGILLVEQAIGADPAKPAAHFNLGGLLVRSGDHEAAIRAFTACLALAPNHANALAGLGRALQASGRPADAVGPMLQALSLTPSDPLLWSDLGTALYGSGRLADAVNAYDRAITLNPDYAEAYFNRGCIRLRQRQFDSAESSFRTALDLRPDHRSALLNLGVAVEAQARHDEALDVFGLFLEHEPEHPIARLQRASILNAIGRHHDALRDFDAVLAVYPDHAEALAGRGGVRWYLQDLPAAESDLDRALALQPAHAGALIDRGNVWQDLQQYDRAIACYDRALAVQPDNVSATANRAAALQMLQRHDDAIAAFQRVLALAPDNDDARLNIAVCDLHAGRWREGWRGYEVRWKLPRWALAIPTFTAPRWDGQSDLTGKRVLLVSELGQGDTLQFCRFVRHVADRGAIVIAGVPASLRRLMLRVDGVSEVAVAGEKAPAYDCYLPLLSLIDTFQLEPEALADTVPYLRADAAAVTVWRQRLAGLPGLKVGLAWAGDPRPNDRGANRMDQRRSLPLAHWAPILSVPGVTFVSLQKGPAAVQAAGLPIIDWMDETEDFADCAALTAAMDLVISVDTAIVHLAGGLGRPVWVLNRYDRCWRWLWNRTDTPWYPAMRLFTQTTPGAWNSPVQEVAAALGQLASGTVQAL